MASQAAEFSKAEYERVLQWEEEPELLVSIPKQAQNKAPMEPMLDATVRLDYAVSTSGRGVHFEGDYCIIDNEVSTRATLLSLLGHTEIHKAFVLLKVIG